MHITNLGYLENRSSHFIELSNGNTEELNRILIRLDITAIISETGNQDLPHLIDLEA